MRARGATGFVPLIAGALLVFVSQRGDSTSSTVVAFTEQSRAELQRLRELAEEAKPSQRESRWFDVARFALEHSSLAWSPPREDDGDVAIVLHKAGTQLPASSLAALSARGVHPTISQAFCRQILNGPAPTGMPASAEASAEARDAIDRFGGGKASRPFLEVLEKHARPASGAGGAQRSVYSILVLQSGSDDSTSSAVSFIRGTEAGVRAASGDWSERFLVHARDAGEADVGVVVHAMLALEESSAGVVAIVGSPTALAGSATLALSQGRVVVDARDPGDVGADPEPFGRIYLSDVKAEVMNRSGMFSMPSNLDYSTPKFDENGSVADYEQRFRPFQLRPTSAERARRLAQVVASRPEIRKVAVALPEHGGDPTLAAAFLAAMRSLGREAELLVYEGGRRSYAPEAAQFVQAKAQGLLLAGPGDEATEWLSAIAARKEPRPLVLGTSELDPRGFHASSRPQLEGAIFTADDWQDRNPTILARFRSLGEAATDPSYRRGFRFGWTVARAVVDGAYTPTSLQLALERRSHPRPMGQYARVLVGIDTLDPKTPTEVALPLLTVRKGEATPLPSP